MDINEGIVIEELMKVYDAIPQKVYNEPLTLWWTELQYNELSKMFESSMLKKGEDFGH